MRHLVYTVFLIFTVEFVCEKEEASFSLLSVTDL